MAIHAQFGGLVLPPYAADEQMQALKYGSALLSTGGDGYCAGQSDLTCNGSGGGAALMPVPSRKRGRENDDELPIPAVGMRRPYAEYSSATAALVASTSGRCADAVPAPDALASSEMLYGGAAEVDADALVRAECDRLRAGLEVARQRQRGALVRAAASSGLARRAREAQAQLELARRRAAELEERVMLAAAEAQAWCGVARGNEAVAKGLQATLDALLLRSATAAEGFGESSAWAEPDDAQSCCVGVDRATGDDDAASPAAKWACRTCGVGEASVLVLPCRHLCLCKACEPRTDACPVCSGDKNAALHIAPN